MAKSNGPSTLEQHIEKAVLGVSLLILAIALSVWGFPSPATVRLGASQVELNKVDEEIVQEADRKRSEAEREPPPKHPETEFLARALDQTREELLDPLSSKLTSKWPEIALALPQPKLLEPPELEPFPILPWDSGDVRPEVLPPTVESLIKTLVEIGQPAVKINRELIHRPDGLVEVIVAHGAAVFPVGELRRGWEPILGKNVPFTFAVVAVEVERQERLADGTWGNDGKAGEAKIIRIVALDKQGVLRPVPDYRQSLPEFDGTERTRNSVRDAVRKLNSETTLQDILEPEFPEIYWPSRKFGTWKLHLPGNEVSSDAIDAGAVPAPAGPGAEWAPEGAGGGRGFEPGVGTTLPALPPAGIRPKPEVIGVPPAPLGAAAGEPMLLPVPAMRQQLANGKVLVWFHDMSPAAEKEYRYRSRMILVNPFLTYTKEVLQEADARQAFVETKWSAWSEGVSVPEVTRMFVTGGWKRQQRVNITVYTERWGQTHEAAFYLEQGQAIGGKRTVELVQPGSGARVKRVVDFQTGAVIVSLDFEKQIMWKNLPRTTIEMLYVNDKGELKRMIRVQDMPPDSEAYTEYLKLKSRAKG